ncbi:MAG: choice-of-anchor L domain-containing protein [Flavobacteriales bacterium]|nr:choice-of-anchor L domain-containing protein [Flavobacteriales bacterium]
MKRTFLFIAALFVSALSFGQLTTMNVAPYNSVQYLVDSVLIGQGIQTSNITFLGAPHAIGFFDGTNSNIGLDSGIVITTGDIANAVGPNNIGSQSTSNNLPGDAQLDLLTTNTTNDASVLEFDFIPESDTASFRFVFGSEEYPEFVNSLFNDVFAFFISGPNPAGGNYVDQNIALIPGTTVPVTIDNVNIGSNPQYYIDNTGGTSVQYDGFTTPLTALAPVICSQPYHIKIAIADAGDFSYDSGVFMEAASFSSNGATVTSVSTSSYTENDTTILEGCGDALVTVKLNRVTPTDSIAPYTLTGTATQGVDYVITPSQLLIPAGSDSIQFTVTGLWDGVDEPNETIFIEFPFQDACLGFQPVKIGLLLRDIDSLKLDYRSPDTTLCGPEDLYLYFQPSGGVAPISFDWQYNGQTSAGFDLQDSPMTSTTYVVTMTDACIGFTLTDSINVTLLSDVEPVDVEVGVTNYDLCLGDLQALNAIVTGGGGAVTFGWYDIDGTLITDSSTFVIEPEEGMVSYTALAFDECGSRDSVEVTINTEICEFEVPNVFTPNGDGNNDYFWIENLDKFPNTEVYVFNRWGQTVFTSTDYGGGCVNNGDSGCWNGKVNNTGADCSEGTYYYVIRAPGEEERKGSINLFRD